LFSIRCRFIPVALLSSVLLLVLACAEAVSEEKDASESIKLPPPRMDSGVSLEEALAQRRSVRSFTTEKLTLKEISQLCWAAQGITRQDRGFRTSPSAGALYPLELYLVTPDGLYHYNPREHELEVLSTQYLRGKLADAALKQSAVYGGTCIFVVTAVYSRTSKKYGDRAKRYVHMEVGHAAQNLLLQAVTLGLGAVPIGAFYDDRVAEVLGLPSDHEPLMIIPVGHPG
jgi:SagB-type dehydrogenase family enzyme